MSDLDDFDLRPPDTGSDEFDTEDSPATESAGALASPRIHPALPVAALVVGLTLVLYFLLRPSTPANRPLPSTSTSTSTAIESAPNPAPTPLDLPPLDQSDAILRGWIAALSANPELAKWLIPDQLIRKFVVTIENIADDEDPAVHLRHLGPETGFQVAGKGAELFADPRGFGRFDGLATITDSISATDAAQLFQNLRPLFDEAYAELGHPEGGFEGTFARALARLLETPAPPRRIDVVRHSMNFEFADRRLEALSPAQKVLIRMGPANRAKVQGKLEEFRAALDAAKRAEAGVPSAQ